MGDTWWPLPCSHVLLHSAVVTDHPPGAGHWHVPLSTSVSDGLKRPSNAGGRCMTKPPFPVWLSACWRPGRKPSPEEAEGRVTCCSRIRSFLALRAIASGARLHLGLAV